MTLEDVSLRFVKQQEDLKKTEASRGVASEVAQLGNAGVKRMRGGLDDDEEDSDDEAMAARLKKRASRGQPKAATGARPSGTAKAAVKPAGVMRSNASGRSVTTARGGAKSVAAGSAAAARDDGDGLLFANDGAGSGDEPAGDTLDDTINYTRILMGENWGRELRPARTLDLQCFLHS